MWSLFAGLEVALDFRLDTRLSSLKGGVAFVLFSCQRMVAIFKWPSPKGGGSFCGRWLVKKGIGNKLAVFAGNYYLTVIYSRQRSSGENIRIMVTLHVHCPPCQGLPLLNFSFQEIRLKKPWLIKLFYSSTWITMFLQFNLLKPRKSVLMLV